MEENVDYYINEQGLLVFTAAYHLKRGYCCKNNCLNCPWKKKTSKLCPNDSIEVNYNDED